MHNIILSPHFCLHEFTESPTARKHGIENSPPMEAVENLQRLCLGTLEPLRESLGLPIIITSGYRSKRLNDILLHSAHRSQHLVGSAADFYVGWSVPSSSRGHTSQSGLSARERLIEAFRMILTSPSIDFDQLILYPNFIHVSYVSPEANRHYIMTANIHGQYRRITKDVALTIE